MNTISKEQLIEAINAYSDARITNNQILIQLSIENINKLLDEIFADK